MVQFLEPISTVSNTWTLSGAATAHECVDETIAGADADTTRIQHGVGAVACKLGLTTTGYKPSDLTQHVVTTRARISGVPSVSTLLVEMMEGATVIASATHNIIPAGTNYTNFTLTLTPTEAAAIVDYTNLFVQLTSTVVGAASTQRVTTCEFSMSSTRAILPSGIASAEAFGTPTLTAGAVTISPSGIASAQAFGTPTVTATVTISPSGIASAQAFGTPTVTATVTVSPSGIASAQAFGTPTVTATVTISPSGIASAQAFGTPTVTAGVATVAPSSIASAEAFGTPTLTAGAATVSPSSIASAEAFGTPTITATVTVSPSAIASAEAFGTPTVTATASISPSGIASAELFGTPTLTTTVTISPSGIASAESFGTPALSTADMIVPVGIPSAEAFGTPTLTAGAVTISPGSIASAEVFGTPTLTSTASISPAGIASAQAFGTPSLTSTASISPSGIASAEAFGTPALSFASLAALIYPEGIASAEAFGLPFLRGGYIPTTMKKRLHDALCERAHMGTFIAATYPKADEGCVLQQGLQVQPKSVEVNEVRATFTVDDQHGASVIQDKRRWEWLMVLRFDQEVVATLFEDALELEPTVVCRDPNDPSSRHARIFLVDCPYVHPPRGSPSNGSELRYRFEVKQSRR